MKKYFEILRKCPLFCGITDESLTAMLGCLDAKACRFGKNQTVIAEGSRARHIGILLSGSLQIVRVDYYGNKSIVATVEPGEIFGESFACAEVEEIPVTVTATEPSEVLLIDCNRVLHACNHACEFHSRMIFNLMKVVAMKNLVFHQKIEITSKRTTREKLMSYLLLQAKKNGSKSFTIPYDRQGLADYLEVDRSGLSTEISKLRREGILMCHRSHFTLL
ncbi:MAG: Crp/Fnr family transcriptional regulator [Clostridia bacterium]|nr:Crp/Fnr family transcriptional regulator [Clostridia bacterium]